MAMATLSMLNPWQLLLWIIALEVVSIPLFIWFFGAVFSSYYREKEKHSGRMANAIGTALTKTANDNLGKLTDAINKVIEMKTKKEEKSDEG